MNTMANTGRALLLAASLMLAAAGCARRPDKGTMVGAGEMKITWRVYEGAGDSESALFMVDGDTVGAGAAGFAAVLNRLDGLPPESNVLIYPYYEPGYVVHVSADGTARRQEESSGPIRWFPFEQYDPEYNRFQRIIADKRLRVSIARDGDGRGRRPMPKGRGVRVFSWPGESPGASNVPPPVSPPTRTLGTPC
jgi:hypothetical protein